MITVASIVTATEQAIAALEESAVIAVTDPNLAGEEAAFERGRLAGLRDARREARRTYEKATKQED